MALCECRNGLRFALALFARDVGGGEGHVGRDKIGVERQSAAKKSDVFLLRGARVGHRADGGHERPGAFGIFFDGGAAVVFRALPSADVNQLGAFCEELERAVIL